MTHVPNFDELVGTDVPAEERERLRRAHELLVQAGPPPELSPELEAVPWPDDSQAPIGLARRRSSRRFSPLLLAAALATALIVGFLLGQGTGTNSSTNSLGEVVRVVRMSGTDLDSNARATLRLGRADTNGNWGMLLQVTQLEILPEGGYYDLWLSRKGKPIAMCGSFNVERHGEVVVPFTAAYELGRFDGWVVTRQVPPNHKPTQIVLQS